jgi:Spy/CpxP family protein refolding chaperone
MKKETFYRIIILALLILNFGILAFIWQGKTGRPPMPPDGRGGGNPAQIIIDRLHLDDNQQQQYDAMREAHHAKMMDIQQESKKLHDALFDLLKVDKADSAKVNSLVQQIQANEAEKEHITFDHFAQLRAILRPDQKTAFDGLIQDILRQMGNRPPPGRE